MAVSISKEHSRARGSVAARLCGHRAGLRRERLRPIPPTVQSYLQTHTLTLASLRWLSIIQKLPVLPPTSLSAAHSTTTTALVPARKRCLHGLHRSFQALEGTGNIHKNTLTFIACYSQEAPRPIVHNARLPTSTSFSVLVFSVLLLVHQSPPSSPFSQSYLALSMAHYKSGFNQSSLLFSLCSSSRGRRSLVKVT